MCAACSHLPTSCRFGPNRNFALVETVDNLQKPTGVAGGGDEHVQGDLASSQRIAVSRKTSSSHFINDTLQVSLETATEHVRGVLASSNELQSAAASAVKAFVLYRKTRPGPSLESIKRSRGLEPEGLHPILAQALPASDLGEWGLRGSIVARPRLLPAPAACLSRLLSELTLSLRRLLHAASIPLVHGRCDPPTHRDLLVVPLV